MSPLQYRTAWKCPLGPDLEIINFTDWLRDPSFHLLYMVNILTFGITNSSGLQLNKEAFLLLPYITNS